MAFERLLDEPLDYAPCRYGRSKLLFRGPKADLKSDYVVFLGGTETYGKYVQHPFPALVGRELGLTAVNLGCVNSGIDAFYDDPSVLDICRNARLCVLQVMGIHALSNRLYSVHPRRNDRFVGASKVLTALYPEVDLAEVNFTRHLLGVLREVSDERFQVVLEELSSAWMSRMKAMLSRIQVPTMLLWAAPRGMADPVGKDIDDEPFGVTVEMLDELSGRLTGLVEVRTRAPRLGEPEQGMIFPELEISAACRLPGPETHAEIAHAIVAAVRDRF